MVLPLSIAVICLLLEAFFSSAEIAIVSADRAHIRRLAEGGHRGARYVEDFLIAPHRMLSTTLLGTQISLVTSTVVITLWLYRVAHDRAELYLLLGLTPMVVILGEIVPKSIVRHNANALAPLMAVGLRAAMRALSPLVALLARASAVVAQRMGIDVHRKLVTREELESMIAARPAGGALVLGEPPQPSDVTEGERSMISRIFDFSAVEVHSLMVPLSDVTALPETASLDLLAREIAEKKYSRVPIYRERVDQIIGVVHAFDVLKAGKAGTAGALMRPPVFVPESHKAVDLLARLQRTRQGMAVVVDEYGGAVGVVTVEDILEEIVGEIDDEYDVGPPAIRRESDGTYRVQARTPISQINRELSVQLPETDDYETLAGLMLDRLKHIPRIGETLRVGGVSGGDVQITVTAANDRRIEEASLRLLKRR